MKLSVAALAYGVFGMHAASAAYIEGPQMYHEQIKLADETANATLGTLVVGGNEVSPRYKYQHVAGMRSTSSGSSFCGGSLISSEWVLTAGHCLSVSHVSVNTHSRQGINDGIQEQVLQAVRHPQYNSYTYDYDFALLRIAPIASGLALPIALEDASGGNSTVGTSATVIGWGATRENGASSSVLMEVDVDIVSNAECDSALGGVTDRMICAGGIQGQDACQGDSGGPFFVSKDTNPILVGAVSWGIGCARAGLPGVYARVSSVRDWIDSTTASAATWEKL